MSREQERAKRKQGKNPIVECNKIQNKYYPELFKKFSEVKRPAKPKLYRLFCKNYAWDFVL